MVTWTAIGSAILQPPCQCSASQNGNKAQRVAGDDIRARQQPLALFEQTKGLERITGKRGERPTEAHGEEQTPARVHQNALAGPNQKKAQRQASGNVDEQRAVRKAGRNYPGDVTAEKVASACARNCTYSNPEVSHDGVLLSDLVGVISPLGA